MNERQLEFRVGLFVIVASTLAAIMIFQFGRFRHFWEPHYLLAIHFPSAPGVYESTPVRRNGIAVGSVREVVFEEEQGGVLVVVEIREGVRLRRDAEPRLVRSLLGDASIDFSPGGSKEFIEPGTRLEGLTASDPMEVVTRMEATVNTAITSFTATSQEWEKVARNLNSLMQTNEGNLNTVIAEAATSLRQFTVTMKNADRTLVEANNLIADPQLQENMRRSIAALPELVEETRATISTVKTAVSKADQNLENLAAVTQPLAGHSESIVVRLDSTLKNLESLSGELNDFAQLTTKEDGTLHRFVADPELYENLNRSAMSLSLLLKNLDPILQDMRIFSDKVARHPELIGVGGALKGSTGLKDPEPGTVPTPARQAIGPRMPRQ